MSSRSSRAVTAITVYNSASLDLLRCDIRNTNRAILVRGQSNLRVKQCMFAHASDGIVTEGGGSIECEHTTFDVGIALKLDELVRGHAIGNRFWARVFGPAIKPAAFKCASNTYSADTDAEDEIEAETGEE